MIKSKSIKAVLKSAKPEDPPIIEGEFDGKVVPDDSFWNVEEKRWLNLNLEKAVEQIWKTVIAGDEEIDTSKVDNSKKVEEFDTETQGHLQKVLYEQKRKQMGLPTTEEEQQ